MSGDASLPPNAPVANGLDRGHGEADASSTTLSEVCADVHSRVSAFLSATPKSDIVKRTQAQTRISLGVIEKALNDYDFSTLSLSYNGGKDCLVLLILYLTALHSHFSATLDRRKESSSSLPSSSTFSAASSSSFPTSIPSIYARAADPFPAVTDFVDTSSRRYHLALTTHVYSQQSKSFRDAFAVYLAERPAVKVIFVGTRRTDPHGEKLTHFDRTDGGWPDFVRCHPVIDWRLSEIWAFLRADALLGLPYCSMYDEGYTSLGGVGDTARNPVLRVVEDGEGGSEGRVRYRPAYELGEDGEERLGRE